MRHDAALADRVRQVLGGRRGVTERRMFGGLAFMVDGHMAVGVLQSNLVLRLGNLAAAQALKRRHVVPMDFTGKPLKSMVYVTPPGYRTDRQLRAWVDQAVQVARAGRKRL